ncbi:MAG: HAD family phosphatase [Treponema sp.]|nr:HAD family phosphatase [Treponema sp.]
MKLFIFDMGGVVTSNASEARGRPAQALGVTQEEMDRAIAEPIGFTDQNAPRENLFDQLTVGKISVKEFWKTVGERLGKKIDTDYFHLFFHPVLNEGTKKIILALRKKGFRVVCGTNTIESHYLNHITRGDYAFFDQTYASQMMGVKKPDPQFWKMILDAEKCAPSDAFFTDDLEANVQAAAALGIHAVRFTSARELKKAIKEFLR